jgi:nitrite reductase/ring-hydroxylating ferredoxin subunit
MAANNDQERIGYMTSSGWEKLLEQVNAQIEELEQISDSEVKDQVFTLLAGIDAIHRESLGRLVSLFKEGVLEQVINDPPIHTLMELYDLLPSLEEHQEQQYDENGFPVIPLDVMTGSKGTAPIKSKIPHWVPVPDSQSALEPNTTDSINVDGHSIILCRVDDEYFAVSASCAQDGSSLETATLNKYTLTCHNHLGCHYDVRQGTRIAARGESIDCYPVEADERRIMIGIDMDFIPNLPVF